MQVDYETMMRILESIFEPGTPLLQATSLYKLENVAIAVVTRLNEVQEIEDRMAANKVRREKLKEHYRIDNLELKAEIDHIQKSCSHYTWAERGNDQVKVVYCKICGVILEQEITP